MGNHESKSNDSESPVEGHKKRVKWRLKEYLLPRRTGSGSTFTGLIEELETQADNAVNESA